MRIIKLGTVKSTNDYLRNLSRVKHVDNLVTVVAQDQTNGRGQRGSTWITEPCKNLTFSVYYEFKKIEPLYLFWTQMSTALAIHSVLEQSTSNRFKIKWPNDILSNHLKIGGVLIESVFSKKKTVKLIIGIGLNVNQERFSPELNNASSLYIITGKYWDRDSILRSIVKYLGIYFKKIENGEFKKIKQEYLSNAYGYLKPLMFLNDKKELFIAKMIGVSNTGKLQLELDDHNIEEFGIKQVQWAKFAN